MRSVQKDNAPQPGVRNVIESLESVRTVCRLQCSRYRQGDAPKSEYESCRRGGYLLLSWWSRVIGRGSRFRPYAQFGGGTIHQTLRSTFTVGNQSSTQTASGSIASFTYGTGVQTFIGRRWGAQMEIDGYRLARPMASGGQGYATFRAGFFFQTKPAAR